MTSDVSTILIFRNTFISAILLTVFDGHRAIWAIFSQLWVVSPIGVPLESGDEKRGEQNLFPGLYEKIYLLLIFCVFCLDHC